MTSLTVHSVYRKETTTLRPQVAKDAQGRACLRISARAFRAAERRCSYVGDGIDFATIPVVAGYGCWQPLQCGDYIARKLGYLGPNQ